MPAPTVARFTMPAEWSRQRATWLAWPHQKRDWPGRFAPIRWVYAEIVRVLSRTGRVAVIVPDPEHEASARRILNAAHADLSNVEFHAVATDRSWVRDSGPTGVFDAAARFTFLDWRFNAWAKYPDHVNDDALPAFVAKARGVPAVQPTRGGVRLVLEGGSFDVNGQGRLLTTEECLLSQVQERNPTLDRAGYEDVFAEYLGVTETVWLGRGIAGDDTHGHVDDLARFVSDSTVVLASESDPTDANYGPLNENRERLQATGLEVVPLPMPRPVVFRGQRLPASYANFTVANGVVIVPTFNDPADRVALGTLAELFPERDVIGVHSVELVWGLGTLHCLTQQEPAHGAG